LGLGFVFFLAIGAVAFGFEQYQAHWRLFLLLAFNQFLLSVLLFMRAALTGLGHYSRDSMMSVVDRLAMIALSLPLFFGPHFKHLRTVETFALVHTAGYVIGIVVCVAMIGKPLFAIKLRFRPFHLKDILRRSFPFALFTGLMALYIYVDFIMIERLMPNGFEHAGRYRKAYRFLEAASMYGLLFGNLLLPVFSALLANKVMFNRLVIMVFKIFVLPAFMVAVVCVLYRNELMDLAYPGEVAVVANTFGVLMVDFVSICLFYLFGTALTALHHMAWLNRLAAAGVVINLVVNMILIPRMGILGAAVATLCTHGAVGLGQAYITLVSCGIKPKWHQALRILGFIGGSVAACIALTYTPIHWSAQLVAGLTLSFTFALFFKVFSLREIALILNKSPNE
jgi:O-antigen/teichoic acid export membrane protein